MGHRVPYARLTELQKARIEKDLCLKEVAPAYNFAQGKKFKGKEIRFYLPDPESRDVILPMHYAGELFGRPIINRSRKFPRVPSFEMTGPPRDYQVEVIDQSLQNFMKQGTTFLNVFCSYGKTWVAAKFASVFSKQYGLISLITYPLTMVGNSWIGTFRNATTAKIYVVGEDVGPVDEDVQIILCMDTMLTKIPLDVRMRVGHFVIDEADSYCTSGRKDGLLSFEPMFVTVLTATYERDDGFHKMLDLMVGPDRIVRISKKPFFVFQKPTQYMVEPKIGPRGVIFDSVVEEYDKIEARNSEILQLVMDNPAEKILILTKHVNHATNLTVWLNHHFQGTGRTASLLAGNKRSYDDANVIVATISKAGRGFDEKEGCTNWNGIRLNMLILASSTKKPEQLIGRILRSDIPIIVDIVDAFKNLQDHWRIRKKWYESRNGQIYQLTDRLYWAAIRDTLMSQYMEKLAKVPPGSNTLPSYIMPSQPSTPIAGVALMQHLEHEEQQESNALAKSHASRIAQQLGLTHNTSLLGKAQQIIQPTSKLVSQLSSTAPRAPLQSSAPVHQNPVQPTANKGSLASNHMARLLQQMNKTKEPAVGEEITLTIVPSTPNEPPKEYVPSRPVSYQQAPESSKQETLVGKGYNRIEMTYLVQGPKISKRATPQAIVEPQASTVSSGSLSKAHLDRIRAQMQKK